jgi:anti-anti-sigma factor
LVSRETFVDGELTITTSRFGREVAVLAFAGGIDGRNVETAEEAFVTAILAGHDVVVIDLRRLESLDREGLDLLVEMSELSDFRRRLRLIPSAAAEVERSLDRGGLRERVSFVADGLFAAAR